MAKFLHEIQEEFWAQVDKNPTDPVAKAKGCWLWKGAKFSNGYGQYHSRSLGTKSAHAAAFRLSHGALNEGEEVRHTCDMPLCCRPDHLLRGTHAQNVGDAVQRDRIKRGYEWDEIHRRK